jgi:hypothetical protein
MKLSSFLVASISLAQMPALAQPSRIDPTFTDARWVSVSLSDHLGDGVSALACDTRGNLYVGGNFSTTGGVSSNTVASWNGSTWSVLGLVDYVTALAFDTSGNLHVGGNFSTAGGVNASGIAKWNGSSWSSLGSGVDGGVGAMAFDANGNLYVGGGFSTAGGVSATNIARWNGSTWSAVGLGLGNADGFVTALACDANGNLYAGGEFPAGAYNPNHIAKWNGSTWLDLGSLGAAGHVGALACDKQGRLYAAGQFTFADTNGVVATNIAKWDGSAWSALGGGLGRTPPPPPSYGVPPDGVGAMVFDTNGNLYAGGQFGSAGAVSAKNIAKWDNGNWSALGSGVGGGFAAHVGALAFDAMGNLYAGGSFTTAGTNGYGSPNLAKALLTGPTLNQVLLGDTRNGTNILTYLGTPGVKYALDLASSLAQPVNWVAQTTNTASTANATTAGYVTFTNSHRAQQAFYRTRSVP